MNLVKRTNARRFQLLFGHVCAFFFLLFFTALGALNGHYSRDVREHISNDAVDVDAKC